MKIALFTTAFSLLTLSTAQSTFENSSIVASAPFYLQITQSHNRTLNGTILSACHEGAAIGSICALPKSTAPPTTYQQFRLNYTSSVCGYTNGTLFPCSYPSDSTTGILTWDEPYNGNLTVSQSVQLVNQGYSSNMAFATIFFPSNGFGTTYFSFDANNRLSLRDGLDKRHPAAAPDLGPQNAYYRWFLCQDYWMYYQWNHLVWVFGDDKPWDGNCQAVGVTRIFV